jgi:hypothetical protein
MGGARCNGRSAMCGVKSQDPLPLRSQELVPKPLIVRGFHPLTCR